MRPGKLKATIILLGLSLGFGLLYWLYQSASAGARDDFTAIDALWLLSTFVILPLAVSIHILCLLRLWLERLLRPRAWLGLDPNRVPYQIGFEEKILIIFSIAVTLPFMIIATLTLPYFVVNSNMTLTRESLWYGLFSLVGGVFIFKHIKFLVRVRLELD